MEIMTVKYLISFFYSVGKEMKEETSTDIIIQLQLSLYKSHYLPRHW